MIGRLLIGITCFLFSLNLQAQENKMPVDIYLPGFGYLLIEDGTTLNDTIKIKHSEDIYFKFFFFDFRGKSYCEVYKNNKLFQKGYYENSLDTLKRYVGMRRRPNEKGGKIQVHKYFQPLKHGEWFETINGKLIKKHYDMGNEE